MINKETIHSRIQTCVNVSIKNLVAINSETILHKQLEEHHVLIEVEVLVIHLPGELEPFVIHADTCSSADACRVARVSAWYSSTRM